MRCFGEGVVVVVVAGEIVQWLGELAASSVPHYRLWWLPKACKISDSVTLCWPLCATVLNAQTHKK